MDVMAVQCIDKGVSMTITHAEFFGVRIGSDKVSSSACKVQCLAGLVRFG